MKALLYTAPKTLAYTDVPPPSAADGEALIKVDTVGICGSDMHAYLGHDERRPPPLILGHEAAGTDERGQRVTVNPLVVCGRCGFCRSGRGNLCRQRQILSMPPRPGAFAQWLCVPRQNLLPVPDAVPLPLAALTEPLACCWHGYRTAARLLAKPTAECVWLVLGGGAIGLGSALVARMHGAARVVVVEPNKIRRAMIEKTEGFEVYESAPAALTAAADVVTDAVGIAATRQTACACVRPGGVVIHIGLGRATGGIDTRRITLQGIIFAGIYTYTATDFADTAAAIFAGKLGTFGWCEQRPLADGAATFEAIRTGKTAAAKILLTPPPTD